MIHLVMRSIPWVALWSVCGVARKEAGQAWLYPGTMIYLLVKLDPGLRKPEAWVMTSQERSTKLLSMIESWCIFTVDKAEDVAHQIDHLLLAGLRGHRGRFGQYQIEAMCK